MKAVVVKSDNLKSIVRFEKEGHARKFYNRVIDEGFEAHIIDCNKATSPPEDYKSRKKRLWCPYCAKTRRFKKFNNYKKCEVCGISDGDFYVRVYNKLDIKGGKLK